MSGTRAPDAELEEEAKVPPESIKEEVVIDGKTWVRSRNPNYPYIPGEPEYVYAEKGREMKGLSWALMSILAKKLGVEEKGKGAAIPEEKLQELVRKEVERVLKEEGLRALAGSDKGKPSGVVGRYVGVYPNPEVPREMEGPSRTLAVAVADAISRQKDLRVASVEKIRAGLDKAGITGGLKKRQSLQALGDVLGVHGLILAGVVPPSGKNPGFLILEIYDTYLGNKIDGIAYPVEGRPDAATIQKFARNNALRLGAAIMNVDWFGRVEFTREGDVYLSLGETAGLKVGDRLKVVSPGKEVINPTTQASLGFTPDETRGELKIKELLGETGAVAQVMSGGPFKPNDKVKAVR
ncbi:MAG: hypothetical protein ACUVXF_05805 [Desulfobaccales bacterium]